MPPNCHKHSKIGRMPFVPGVRRGGQRLQRPVALALRERRAVWPVKTTTTGGQINGAAWHMPAALCSRPHCAASAHGYRPRPSRVKLDGDPAAAYVVSTSAPPADTSRRRPPPPRAHDPWSWIVRRRRPRRRSGRSRLRITIGPPYARARVELEHANLAGLAEETNSVLRVPTATDVQASRRRCSEGAEHGHARRSEPDRIVARRRASWFNRWKTRHRTKIDAWKQIGEAFLLLDLGIEAVRNIGVAHTVPISIEIDGVRVRTSRTAEAHRSVDGPCDGHHPRLWRRPDIYRAGAISLIVVERRQYLRDCNAASVTIQTERERQLDQE